MCGFPLPLYLDISFVSLKSIFPWCTSHIEKNPFSSFSTTSSFFPPQPAFFYQIDNYFEQWDFCFCFRHLKRIIYRMWLNTYPIVGTSVSRRWLKVKSLLCQFGHQPFKHFEHLGPMLLPNVSVVSWLFSSLVLLISIPDLIITIF